MTLCFRQAKGEAYASLPWAAGRACSCDEGARGCKGLPCSPRPPSPARASPASVCGASRADGQAPKQVIGGWRCEKAITCKRFSRKAFFCSHATPRRGLGLMRALVAVVLPCLCVAAEHPWRPRLPPHSSSSVDSTHVDPHSPLDRRSLSASLDASLEELDGRSMRLRRRAPAPAPGEARRLLLSLWRRRDDPRVLIPTLQTLVAMACHESAVDELEAYLPQLAQLLSELPADSLLTSILERFALRVCATNVHWALQLSWLAYGGLEANRPELPGADARAHDRCARLLQLIEQAVVYGARPLSRDRLREVSLKHNVNVWLDSMDSTAKGSTAEGVGGVAEGVGGADSSSLERASSLEDGPQSAPPLSAAPAISADRTLRCYLLSRKQRETYGGKQHPPVHPLPLHPLPLHPLPLHPPYTPPTAPTLHFPLHPRPYSVALLRPRGVGAPLVRAQGRGLVLREARGRWKDARRHAHGTVVPHRTAPLAKGRQKRSQPFRPFAPSPLHPFTPSPFHPFTLALAVSPTLSVSLSVNPTPKPHGLTIHRWAITSSSPRDSRGGR